MTTPTNLNAASIGIRTTALSLLIACAAPGTSPPGDLLIRSHEASTPVRAEPAEAQVARATLRQAQGERFKLQRAGSISSALAGTTATAASSPTPTGTPPAASPAGAPPILPFDEAVLRAEVVKIEIDRRAPGLAKRMISNDVGPRENWVDNGKDDSSDALDRRSAFKVMAC
jgi:hypothetical protein